jgi:endosialidase-like protein
MNLRNLAIALVVMSIGFGAAQSHAAGRSLRIDNPGAQCDLQNWVAFAPDPYARINGNGNGLQSSATFFNPGTIVTPPAIYCTPNESLTSIWSNDFNDSANPASQPDGSNNPTILYLTATAGVMYEWINPSDSNLTPDAEVIIWSLPPSSQLGAGAVEIEFDNWCNSNDGGSGTSAPPGAIPSFTWRGYLYSFTGTCASFNGYDLLISGSGGLLGYVDLSNVTHLSATVPGWQMAVSPVTTNIGIGSGALLSNTTGYANAAVGYNAMFANTTGPNNTAFGSNALYSNTSGKGNAAQGSNALYNNSTGIRNLGIGSDALYANTTGSYNIALGFEAGYNVTTGSNNIELGSMGAANDNGTIQIGTQGTQVQAKIAGIYGTQITGSAVYVTSAGQLGVQGSSERFKTDIAPMPETSAKLDQLRPVTFRYKSDPRNVMQYGLIAEEVARVYPELVIRDDSDQIQGIHYEELAPLLLQEVQQQRRKLREQSRQLTAQRDSLDAERSLRNAQTKKIEQLERQFDQLNRELARLQRQQ